MRDIFSAHFERAIVDDPKQYQRLVSFFTRTAPELVDRVELWEDDGNLFEAYGVDPVIEGMLSRRVDLPSGGYLMIDYAEALTVIDVNTGSFTGKGKAARLEDTITQTNLEAAEEVVNQLRLRDIGGIIVIDFIDMARARNRDAVLKVLRKALDEDRTKTFVVEISPLGLVEMTRQNVTDGVREIMTKTCPTCDGEGVVKSEETIAIEVERHLRELVADAGDDGPEAFLVRINPRVTACFTADGARDAARARGRHRALLQLQGLRGAAARPLRDRPGGPARRRSRRRAVPFREGEEVHVDIVEPHMYSEDDAVAKVDGYMIEVTDAIPYVGEKMLVRIEEAGRTSARAVLADVAEEAAAATEERAKARERAAKRAATAARNRRARSRRRRAVRLRGGRRVEALADDETGVHAGTGPAAVAEADEDAAKPRRRGRGRARSAAEAEPEAEAPRRSATEDSDDDAV